MSSRLGERTSPTRRRRFVGRANERAIFQDALLASELPFQILFVVGPGGVGKTTLLREFAALAENVNISTTYVDARNLDPIPSSFVDAISAALGFEPHTNFCTQLASQTERHVVLVDTYETLAPLDSWISQTLWNQLPDNTLFVLASRNPPAPVWRAEPGSESFVHTLPLRNLSPDESRDYLNQRHVPAEQHQAVLDFTHGHPLALSLVADVLAQRPSSHFEPEAAPDVIQLLLERLVQKVPSPAHRVALEATALVRVMTEALLAQMLQKAEPSNSNDAMPDETVHELFHWLRNLSFIESGREGLFPHDLAREALAADLHWRNPDWYKELHHRARAYYATRVQQTRGLEQQRTLYDYVFLHRHNPVIRSMLEWQGGETTILPDMMRDSDRAGLMAMVKQHEGEESANLAALWLKRQPAGVTVYRNENDQAIGFIAMVELERASADDIKLDPAMRAAWNYLERKAPLRPGEVAVHYRFWMAQDTYQNVSPVQTHIFLNTVRYQLTTPGLAYHFLPCAHPEMWAGAFGYANLQRLTEADFTIDKKHYGVYGHDWRIEPPMAWLALLAEREVATDPSTIEPPPRNETLVVLSEQEFASAVRQALIDFTNVELLRRNPLAQSRMVFQRAGTNASPAEHAAILQTLLKEAAESLQSTPRQNKLYRALYHTYFQPAATQEAAAEAIDVPFSTYRRHLKAGMERVTDILWQQEIGK